MKRVLTLAGAFVLLCASFAAAQNKAALPVEQLTTDEVIGQTLGIRLSPGYHEKYKDVIEEDRWNGWNAPCDCGGNAVCIESCA